ncbi:hypothetical protein [Armatimonas sp.]|uniref:hypothetical protein n=1 Tax=Armatimonas sp. TaxID=1872638 RepID=UPI00286B9EC8|nr:hypothetical protein [Armatimonas sp.]
MSSLLASLLYVLAGLLLASAASFLWIRERRSLLVSWFMAVSVSLLAWITTLYMYQYAPTPEVVLQAGRFNLAATVLAAYATYRFTRALAQHPKHVVDSLLGWGALLFALASAATPWVDKAERVGDVAGFHLSQYGWLAPVYLLYVIVLLVAAVMLAFWERKEGKVSVSVRSQLLLLGVGIPVSVGISFITNVLIPLVWGSYRWINIGPLLVLLVMPAVVYVRVAGSSRSSR